LEERSVNGSIFRRPYVVLRCLLSDLCYNGPGYFNIIT
jgi:hypothetical protein